MSVGSRAAAYIETWKRHCHRDTGMIGLYTLGVPLPCYVALHVGHTSHSWEREREAHFWRCMSQGNINAIIGNLPWVQDPALRTK